MSKTVLHIDSSARLADSASRKVSAQIVEHLAPFRVIRRDVGEDTLPLLTETWVGATNTPADARTEAQKQALALSDVLVDELEAADVIVIGLPVYNFSMPASLKAWVDQVARVGRTFQYTENGPEGLLNGKRAIVAYASGGVPMGSPVDFASNYLRHVLGFIGITEVEFVAAEGMAINPEEALNKASAAVTELAA
ncbi:MAG: FMN-dependent NADH-azoreductase [Rhodobacteraceae bacterium]|nr:FMN-dependent NADH-azoreductase [Paracoccaceae bacterium]